MSEIAMRRPRIAIDAAMLATAIRIDRPIETQVRTVVGRNNTARRLDPDLRFEGVEIT